MLVATFVPLFASIADVYGRHPAIQSALALFFVGSALSTGAANIPMLLVGRGISGIGVAGLLTVCLHECLSSYRLFESSFLGGPYHYF